MDRKTLDSLDKETLIRLIRSQAEAIERLTREVEALRADNAKLHADNAELRAARKFQHSAEPRRQGLRRRSEDIRRKAAQGARRDAPPARDVFVGSCQHCGAFFLNTPRFVREAYDHIEIPPIVPHVTRVSLLGGACPCRAGKFKAEPPQDMPKGSPFGPNLRALVSYLRFTQGIALAASDAPVRPARARHQRGSARQHARRRAGSFHGGYRRDPR